MADREKEGSVCRSGKEERCCCESRSKFEPDRSRLRLSPIPASLPFLAATRLLLGLPTLPNNRNPLDSDQLAFRRVLLPSDALLPIPRRQDPFRLLGPRLPFLSTLLSLRLLLRGREIRGVDRESSPVRAGGVRLGGVDFFGREESRGRVCGREGRLDRDGGKVRDGRDGRFRLGGKRGRQINWPLESAKQLALDNATQDSPPWG